MSAIDNQRIELANQLRRELASENRLTRIFHDGQSERRIPGRNEMDWRRASIRVRKEAIFQVADRISPYPVVCHRAGSSTWCRLRRQGASSSQEDLAQRVI